MPEGPGYNLVDSFRAGLAFDRAPHGERSSRQEREMQLMKEYCQSSPANQFRQQTNEEKHILANKFPSRDMGNIAKRAYETVRSLWVEQGIWIDKWDKENDELPCGRWKHEEPVGPDNDLEMDSQAGAPACIFTGGECAPGMPAGEPKSLLAQLQAVEKAKLQKRQREASRPFHQFFYQVSLERDRLRKERSIFEIYPSVETQILQVFEQGTATETFYVPLTLDMTRADINTMAYERVKEAWMDRGIWDRKWGVLPGMAWKHEKSLEKFLEEEMRDDFPVDGAMLGDNGHGTGEASGPHVTHPFHPTQAGRPAPCPMNVPQTHPSDLFGNLGHGGGGASPRGPQFPDAPPAESRFLNPLSSKANIFQSTARWNSRTCLGD